MSWSSVVMYHGLLILMLCLTQCSAKCEDKQAPRNCSIIHNCTADTGLVDLTCYDLTSDSHRCGYRRAAPTELGVKIPQQNDVGRYNRIPDANMKASSKVNMAKLARIGLAKDQVWCAAENDNNPWLEVDLGVPTDVERIEVEGNPQQSNWGQQRFSVSHYNGSHMIPYRNGHVFTSTPSDMCHYVFINRTQIIRVISNTTKPCLRLAIYGNPPVEINSEDDKPKYVKVKERDTIVVTCPNRTGQTIQWSKPSRNPQLPKLKPGRELRVSDVKKGDAGQYVCKHIDLNGRVKMTYSVFLWVEVPLFIQLTIRIINWNFTKELKDNLSKEYKKFEAHFKVEMDRLYQFHPGYEGVVIMEINPGSVKIRFRVKIVVTIKDSSQTTTGANVNATQALINKASTGWVGNLQVDSSPEAVEISAPPPSPENIRLVEVSKDGAELAWDRPRNYLYFSIKGYVIEYWVFGSTTKMTTDSHKGVATKLTGLEPETAYVARVVAENPNGRGEGSKDIDIKTEATFPSWAIAVIVIGCVVLLVILIVVCVCYRRNKQREGPRDDLNMSKLEKLKDYHPRSYLNRAMFPISEKCTVFPREHLVVLYELGSGEFGVVFKGQLLNENSETIDCAVKTLKGSASDEDTRELYKELDIMANVGYHENLVNLIGACTDSSKKEDKLFVLVEYVRHGSLLDNLTKQRIEPEEANELELNYVNRLNIALDVAKGMSYLAMKRCVHRDIAARNILLAENFVAKVADFGLSRDVYETGEYEKKTSGKLPTRWMALESLEQRKFTLESDVWSFGVLLWEIETKGLVPHGAISFKELLVKQKNGYRLEQPSGTPDKLYRLMQICWSADPKKRPSFSQICDLIEVLKNEEQDKRLSE